MADATPEQWAALSAAQAVPLGDRVLEALRALAGWDFGFPVDQLTHCLQTATRAERAGADTDMVVAALCHDIGKMIPDSYHSLIAAQLVEPYVRPEVSAVIRVHGLFQRRYTSQYLGGDAEGRRRYRYEPWYGLAERFADEWDQAAFDPAYDTLSLDHFEARVREVFARSPRPVPRPSRTDRLRSAVRRRLSR